MVRERRLLSEELGPADSEAGLANVRGRVSVPGGCVGILLGYTLTIPTDDRKLLKPAPTSPFLCLELTQICAYLFFFSSTFLVVYVVSCVFVKQCKMPLAGDERNH